MNPSENILTRLTTLQIRLKKTGLTLLFTTFGYISLSFILHTVFMSLISKRFVQILLMLPGVIALPVIFILIKQFLALRKEYKTIYKEQFVQSILNETFENVCYYPNKGLSQDEVKAMHLCKMGNCFSSEDLIEACYHGVPFRQSDVTITHESETENSSHTTTYFSGRMYDFTFPKSFETSLQVQSVAYRYPATLDKSYRPIELESVTFNQNFKINTQDDHTAFYLLTPPLMEQMQEISRIYQNKVNFHFERNHLYIATWTNFNALEPPSIYIPIDLATERARVLSTLQTIIDFVDRFHLD